MSDSQQRPGSANAPSIPLRSKRVTAPPFSPPPPPINQYSMVPSVIPGSAQRTDRSSSSPGRSLIPQQRQHSAESLLSTSTAHQAGQSTDASSMRSDRASSMASTAVADGSPSVPSSIRSTKSSSSSSLSNTGEPLVSAREHRGELGSLEDAFANLNGEEVKLTSKTVQHVDGSTDALQSGVLTITNYRLIFRAANPADSFDLPLSFISSIDKVSTTSNSQNSFRLRITCKDLRREVFVVTKNADQPSQKHFLDVLKAHAFPLSYKRQLFAFDYKGEYSSEGWSVYDAKTEYKRQGLPNDMWRIANVNQKYELCETYPSVLAVPLNASDELLFGVASFRSRGRLPVLSWIHPVSHATITRCSQPQVGLNGRRSKDDENYVKLIHDANPSYPRLCIMDARPLVNAAANKAKGGGYESEENYPSSDLVFLDIHNIHVMRESLRKVREMCTPRIEDPNHFYSNLEATHWLSHIKAILAGALKIVDKVETYKSSVLVHCSDGWDRTSQLTSLSMIMLDPFYRTIRGFQVLIEKEWVSFGHKFAHRIGHGEEKEATERSPVFLQFIDCVWQLTEQFETSFEFNERFLIAIIDNVHNCRFGTFLSNFEKEHGEKNLKVKTVSLWSYINSDLTEYRNPFYYQQPQDSTGVDNVLYPLTTHRYLKLWLRYYARYDPSVKYQEPIEERHKQLLYALQRLTELRDNLKKEAAARRDSNAKNNNNINTIPRSSSNHSRVTEPVHV
ncbi:hypothetical protein RvY_08487 [Ramazzottius varieornatus]|uniref:phosphatidylinositol-3,5-bisphosphate 3-phosphatase n=1 Tax=Ramazzottius varieornatus TaxID=947166 RepID=A0A1D1V8M5_RAMVA|nr:hypothetical protein RvY_08487 [Ramazzottius varieornatus]